MDISTIIKSTISNLSEPHVIDSSNHGEINITETNFEKHVKDISSQDVDKLLDGLNQAASNVDNRVSFSYNEKTKRILMRISDPVTKEIVKQIPSREMIRILENIHDLVGMFIDEQR